MADEEANGEDKLDIFVKVLCIQYEISIYPLNKITDKENPIRVIWDALDFENGEETHFIFIICPATNKGFFSCAKKDTIISIVEKLTAKLAIPALEKTKNKNGLVSKKDFEKMWGKNA